MAEQHDPTMYLDTTGEYRPENPKMAGSRMVACRPQAGPCDGQCQDCFFQGGRYYEDIDVPHVPDIDWANNHGYLVRVNDGNDSNFQREFVEWTTAPYDRKYFNTRIPKLDFPAPVVFTCNGDYTDEAFHAVPAVNMGNLMAVRFRLNSWNVGLARGAINHYTPKGVPVLLTWMAYYAETVREPDRYEWKQRTLNSYWVPTLETRVKILDALDVPEVPLVTDDDLILTCGRPDSHFCRDCMNCMRLYERAMGQ